MKLCSFANIEQYIEPYECACIYLVVIAAFMWLLQKRILLYVTLQN